MGLAFFPGREARRGPAAESGQSPYEGGKAGDGPGRLGTRVLFEVSEPPARLHRSLVECGQLGRDRGEFRGREKVVSARKNAGQLRRAHSALKSGPFSTSSLLSKHCRQTATPSS